MKSLLGKIIGYFLRGKKTIHSQTARHRTAAYNSIEDTGEFPREDWGRLIEERESLEKPRR